MRVIATVNDLAEQSNLLSVNASIEAAKAGEAGKGFTVVATEVKSLAEQSKRSVAQVRGVLSEIQKASKGGSAATTVRAVSGGCDYYLVLAGDGSIWAWGNNREGQLGNGTKSAGYDTPPAQIGSDADWAAVTGGAGWSLALKRDGSLWGWGTLGYWNRCFTPTRIGEDSDWVTVSTSGTSALALKADGSLWGWSSSNHSSAGTIGKPDRIGFDSTGPR